MPLVHELELSQVTFETELKVAVSFVFLCAEKFRVKLEQRKGSKATSTQQQEHVAVNGGL